MKVRRSALYKGRITQKCAQAYIEERTARDKKNRRWVRLDTLLYFLFVVLIAFSIRAAVMEPRDIKGSSMEPTFFEKDYVLMEKLSYALSPMKRGDIVILHYPKNEQHAAVKRIIGLPGERVDIQQGKVYINGSPLQESYIKVKLNSYHDGSWVVPEDSLFVLGDNRPISKDSTNSTVGCVGMERVLGRVFLRLYPLDRISLFHEISYES